MSWTEERVDLLKKLWADGESASAIAAALGALTRNAVIGKVHRLQLAGRRSLRRQTQAGDRVFSARGRSRKSRMRSSEAARWSHPLRGFSKPLPPLARAPEETVTIATLATSHCRWPEGDPKRPDFHFCGRAVGKTSPYCPHHAARAHA